MGSRDDERKKFNKNLGNNVVSNSSLNMYDVGDKNNIYETQFNKASSPQIIRKNTYNINGAGNIQNSKGKFEDLLKRNQNNSNTNIKPVL